MIAEAQPGAVPPVAQPASAPQELPVYTADMLLAADEANEAREGDEEDREMEEGLTRGDGPGAAGLPRRTPMRSVRMPASGAANQADGSGVGAANVRTTRRTSREQRASEAQVT